MAYTPIFGEDMMQLIVDRERLQNPPRSFSITMREMAETCGSLIAATIQPTKDEYKREGFGDLFIKYFIDGYKKSLQELDTIEKNVK